MAETRTLSDELAIMVADVSGSIEIALKKHLSLLPIQPALSDKTKADVAIRVPPRTLAKYQTPEKAIMLLAIEIGDLGSRISQYRFIERYRDHFTPENTEMRLAFVSHIHALRGAEIYLIMERCSKCVSFFFNLASDLDLAPKAVTGGLIKQFKTAFARHLRERHRLVHAHERPSLISRLMAVTPSEIGHPEIQSNYAAVAQSFLSKIKPQVGDLEGKTEAETLALINSFRLKAVDEESLKMWSILVEALTNLIDRKRLRKIDEPA